MAIRQILLISLVLVVMANGANHGDCKCKTTGTARFPVTKLLFNRCDDCSYPMKDTTYLGMDARTGTFRFKCSCHCEPMPASYC